MPTKNRELKRLTELFSGLERPVFNPVVDVLESATETESPPSGRTELDKPFLDYPVAEVDMEQGLPASLELEEQTPEFFVLDESAQTDILNTTPEPEQEQPVAFITAELEQSPVLDLVPEFEQKQTVAFIAAETEPTAILDLAPELEHTPPEAWIPTVSESTAVLDSIPELEQQQPEALRSMEAEPMALLSPARQLNTVPKSISSVPAFSRVITSPLSHRSDREASPARQLTETELSLLTWQAIGIGILIGGLVTAVVLALTSHLDIFGIWGRTALAGGEVLFAILGALFNISSRKTRRAMWLGAAGWSLIPILATVVFMLLLTMVMFTNFFGV